jgi:hypothetical protein
MNLTKEERDILSKLLNLATGSHALPNPEDLTFAKMTVEQLRSFDLQQLNQLTQKINTLY